MPSQYSGETAKLKYVALDDAVLLSIGRLVRAFADYEEITNLFIAGLTKLTQSQALILLGRAGIANRLKMAEHLAKITPGEHLDRFKKAFDTDFFRDAHQCRNATAHGTYLGMDDEGFVAFLTDKTDNPVGQSTVQIVISYLPATIKEVSLAAAKNVDPMAKILGLETWLKKHQPQTLRPHKKGRLPRNRGDKPLHPREP